MIPVDQTISSPGSFYDEVRGVADPQSILSVSFEFPRAWVAAKGPNIDVRDMRTGDGAYILAEPLDRSVPVEALPVDFFTKALFSPKGKYSAYGSVDDYRVARDGAAQRKDGSSYRALDVKFSAPSFNYNLVERRVLVAATTVDNGCYFLCASCLATRFPAMADTLQNICASFSVQRVRRGAAVEGDRAMGAA